MTSPTLEPLNVSTIGAIRVGATAYRHSALVDGRELTVLYLVDDAVNRDRCESGVGPVLSEKLLAALLDLPEDDLARVSSRFSHAFDDNASSALATIIDDPNGGRWGRRTLRPAVEVLEIEARAETWSHGAVVAHRWAGYGQRVVCLADGREAQEPFVLTQAAHYGIGIRVADRVVLEPVAYSPRRWTSARWLFAEVVYGQFLELTRN